MAANGADFVTFVLRVSVVIAVVAMAPLSWLIGEWVGVIGCFSGVIIGMANFYGLAWIVRRLLKVSASEGSKRRVGLLLAVKLVATLALIWLVIFLFGLDIHGFVLGFSAVVMAMLIGGFRASLALQDGGDQTEDG